MKADDARAASGRSGGRVLVVGSVNVDLVVVVATLPRPGETVIGGTFSRHAGGKGANQAVAAARLGADVVFVGAVGADAMADEAEAELTAEGIETRLLRVEGAPTGVAAIVVDERGENQIAVASGANERLDEASLGGLVAGMAPPTVVLTNLEVPDVAVLGALRLARDEGVRAILNTAPARAIPAEVLALGPILVANRGEAALLARTGLAEDDGVGGAEPTALARFLVDLTGSPAVVTLGAEGACVADTRGALLVPATPVEARDTTGAGDTFSGALAAELALGRGIRDAVAFAVVAAGLSVTAAGARGGMPGRASVERARRTPRGGYAPDPSGSSP